MTASLRNGGGLDAVITIPWVSNSSGEYTETIPASLYGYGTLRKAAFDPDASGTQPTDLYDITLLDAGGIDVLGATGANLSNASTVEKDTSDFGTDQVMSGDLSFAVANAGSAKGGTVYLYYSR